jgi:hypothetical protein
MLIVTWSSLVLPCGATDEAYQWRITAPTGEVKYGSGENFTFTPTAIGYWEIELTVIYQHEDRSQPGTQYTFTTMRQFVVWEPLFTDGFENGTTSAWSATIGG